MKKLPALLLSASLLVSSVCGFVPASTTADTNQSITESSDSKYPNDISSVSYKDSVRFTAQKGDDLTLYFNLKKANRTLGLLSELKFTNTYLSYIDYDQYYTDTFVNPINNSDYMFSILFDPTGTTVTDESAVIAFNFKAVRDITTDDVVVNYIIKEFYDSEFNDMNFDCLNIKMVNNSGTSTDTPHIHSAVIHEAVSPTCTTEGWGEWAECSVCGEILTPKITLPAKGHTVVTDPAVAATCTHTGLTEGSHCSECGTVITKQETIPTTDHTPVVDKEIAATCTHTGKTEGSHCSVCGTVITPQEDIPMTAHNYVNGKCTVCGKVEGSADDTDTDTDSTIIDGIYGDVSGDGYVTTKDALIVLRYAIKLVKLDNAQLKLADVNSDGKVNATDALLIQRYGVGISSNPNIGKKYS